MTRGLYANLFKKLGINHQIVLTSERSGVKFDGDFQSWNYLSDYLIYLPDEDIYIDPSNQAFRNGCINGELTATEGLFIKLVKIGNFESALGKIQYIKPSAYDANYHNMLIDISINTEESEVNVVTKTGLKGLGGGYAIQYYKMMDDEQKQNMLKNLMGNETSNMVFNKLEVLENCNDKSIKDAEFAFISDINTSSILEQAGNRLLLNVGETIGQQTEMYFDEKRTALIENDFNRYYYREIVVHIPDGYKIINPEVADMNFVENKGGEDNYSFVSTHSIKDNEYKIIIDECYKKIFADATQFAGFKEVVNAAADFNKIVLVLEKI